MRSSPDRPYLGGQKYLYEQLVESWDGVHGYNSSWRTSPCRTTR
jgi:hypothetical protein